MTTKTLEANLNQAKLRKVRSKMVREALNNGASSNGNHKVVTLFDMANKSLMFTVYYRGTVIADIEFSPASERFRMVPVDAGEYENTPATIRQRKEIQEAIVELQGVVDAVYTKAAVI